MRTAVVIGASGLVGAAVARRLIASNVPVVLSCTTEFSHQRRDLADLRDQRWLYADVRNEVEIKTLVSDVTESSADGFDLIYCAGMTADKPIPSITLDDWRRTMGVNLDGAFLLIRSAFKKMAVQGCGSIVLLSSISGRRAQHGQAAYAASKGAIEALCRSTALELGRFGVTCNAVVPGPLEGGLMRTVQAEVIDMLKKRTPLRKMGSAEDAAAAVHFLLSESAKHITGQTLVVDGGFTIT